MSDTNSDVKYGHAEQHYAVMDATGRMVVIEPSQAPLRLRENPLGVLTNHPNFDSQIRRLHDYVTFSPAFEQGTVPLNTYHVTTGELSGKKTPPGAYAGRVYERAGRSTGGPDHGRRHDQSPVGYGYGPAKQGAPTDVFSLPFNCRGGDLHLLLSSLRPIGDDGANANAGISSPANAAIISQ